MLYPYMQTGGLRERLTAVHAVIEGFSEGRKAASPVKTRESSLTNEQLQRLISGWSCSFAVRARVSRGIPILWEELFILLCPKGFGEQLKSSSKWGSRTRARRSSLFIYGKGTGEGALSSQNLDLVYDFNERWTVVGLIRSLSAMALIL